MTITQAWTTHNALRTQIELENQIAKGLKLDTTTTLHPEKNTKSVLLGAAYKQPGIHARAVLDIFKVRVIRPSWLPLYLPFFSPYSRFSLKGPTFTADTVLGRDGFLIGTEASYNVTEGRVTKYSGAVGFSAPEYAVTLHGLSNLSTFAASYYHRVSPDVEAGAKAIYDTNATSPGVGLEVGTKAYAYHSTRLILVRPDGGHHNSSYLDSAAFIKAKINNAGVLAVGGYLMWL